MLEKDGLILETFPIGTLGCNCSLIYSKKTKETLIIDPGNDAPTLLSMIKERDLKPKKLLHTHAHFDHIGQSGEIKKACNCSMHLHQDDMFLYEALDQQAAFFHQPVGVKESIDSYLQDEEEFGLEDQGLQKFLKTIHTPGHTPGSCSFYTDFFEHPILFAGDTLFQNSIGRTDLPGGDFDKIIKSIKTRLFDLPEETSVVTGHGPSTSILHERSHNPFVC